MNIIIRNTSNKPIYEQICDQLKSAIIANEMKEGDSLPSIRNLAKDLRISVITTKRAYDELELNGFIETVPGKGSFVASKNTEVLRESQLQEIESHIIKILEIAPSCNLKAEDVIEMFKILSEEN